MCARGTTIPVANMADSSASEYAILFSLSIAGEVEGETRMSDCEYEKCF